MLGSMLRLSVVVPIAASLLPIAACGSSSALRVRAPDHGSLVDRTVTLQESMYALVGKSAGSDEAAMRIGEYCEANVAWLAKMRDDAAAIPESSQQAFAIELRDKTVALVERVEKALSERKILLMADQRVLAAIQTCAPRPPSEPEAPAAPDQSIRPE